MEEEYQVLNRYGSGHRRNDGNYVVEILYVAFYVVLYMVKTLEKLQMVAQVIVPIENPQDIIVQSAGSMDRELF
ncbi:hypothetical protein Bca4012_048274 [Brassica carinata]|uniref:Uncharacterized protein n=1 Tax=Brassica carinata TaxID=52824 RepID=A0A8X7UII4_BRACI|nr:hypothetical protein Bca52824_051257 [Brassica carinata]